MGGQGNYLWDYLLLKVDDRRTANNVIADKIGCQIKGLSESKEVTAPGRTLKEHGI